MKCILSLVHLKNITFSHTHTFHLELGKHSAQEILTYTHVSCGKTKKHLGSFFSLKRFQKLYI